MNVDPVPRSLGDMLARRQARVEMRVLHNEPPEPDTDLHWDLTTKLAIEHTQIVADIKFVARVVRIGVVAAPPLAAVTAILAYLGVL